MTTKNYSSSPDVSEQLVLVPIGHLHQHPANPNLMSEERLEKLTRHIEVEDRYPPLVARPHPERPDEWQVLDGHQRLEVLRRLGRTEVMVFPWPCDDETALMLLATLNRLAGEDVPARRADLLAELAALRPLEELALLLPESSAGIEQALALIDFDTEALLADLARAAERSERQAPRLMSFAVLPEDESDIESAISGTASGMEGSNRRGRALAMICRGYQERRDV